MEQEKLKASFDTLSSDLFKVIKELEILKQEVHLNMDKNLISEMLTDLRWACENCTVIGLHQVGKALEDNMGMGHCD